MTAINKTLAGIYRLTKGAVNQQLAHLNIRATQSDLLLYISEYPDQLQKTIALANCVDPSLLARDLALLEARGWLERTADPSDKRARRVRLTPAGAALAAELKHLSTQWWQEFAAAHPAIDLDAFTALADEVYRALNEGERHD